MLELLARPGAGILALIWVIGVYAVFFGILAITLGVKVRNLKPGLESD